jgi:predicted amidophosphoribosyltransferase
LSEEEFIVDEPEFVFDEPVFEVVGDIYVCSSCGNPLTEIPAYNRYYCEDCGLHY